MATLCTARDLSGLFRYPVRHLANQSSSVWTMNRFWPCMKCSEWFGLRSSGNVLFGVCGQRWASGVVRTKPGIQDKGTKSHWRKKKKKNSDMSQTIHVDLLKVLEKRAVQLVFSREANQLHRTLVTNFTFMDFPLQGPPDAALLEGEAQMVSSATADRTAAFTQATDSAECLQSSVQTPRTSSSHGHWEQQFVSFDQKLQSVLVSGQGLHHVKDANHSSTAAAADSTYSNLAGDTQSFSFTDTLSENEIAAGGHRVSPVDKIVSSVFTSLPGSPQQSQQACPSASSESRSPRTDASEGLLSTQLSASQPGQPQVSVITKNQSTKPSNTASVSVNANILKGKKRVVGKRQGSSQMKAHPESVGVSLLGEDVVMTDMHLVTDVDDVDAMAATGMADLQLQKTASKAQLQRLQKSRQERGRFQSNPAKFNHVFNQELLAYVDACCFAGLESMAHNVVKLNHHSKTSDKKSLPGMRKIEDINIYNKIMHAWAKKCQWGQLQDLLFLMREDGLVPNMQSYAALWECVGRQHTLDISAASALLSDMNSQGLDIKDIFNRCILFKDEHQVILKAIRAVAPGYTPNPPPYPVAPSGCLVDDLQTPPQLQVDKNPYADIVSREEAGRLLETQLQRELRSTVSVQSILKQAPPSRRVLDYRKKVTVLKEEWRGQLTKAFEKKLRYMARKAKMEYGMTLYPYLKVLEPKDYVQCMMQEVEELASASEAFSPNKSYLWRRLSGRVFNRFIMVEKIKNKIPKMVSDVYQQYVDDFLDTDLDLSSHRQLWQQLTLDSQTSLDVPEKVWPPHVCLALGKLLYEMIIYDVKVDTQMLKTAPGNRNLVPAFYTIYRNYSYQTMEEIKPHPVVMKVYQGAELRELSFDSSFLPMLVPPIPWVSPSQGGYLLSAVQLVRVPMQAQAQRQRLEQTVDSLSTVLDAINTLSACAWLINKPVLDIIISVFNNDGDASLNIPPPAGACPPPPPITQEMSAQEKTAAYRQRQKLKAQKSEMYSLWCQELYKLSIANKFRDEVFWFPHNLDFRGRTYPCPPHFNHLGSDVTRSILMFARGKPLGPQGLDWMKIHLINLTGFKKRSPNRERLAYANHLMPEILDSAENPLTGNKWWQKSDEPWQTLACCMEIAKASRSPDPEHYVCHLPIHQDGSCNGLQHYAALGRDTSGAQSVNLWPYDHPQDVYSDVCALVERERQKDAAEGVEIAQQLEGFVRRKVIKQTVMTTVYGVTRYGAKAQILRQLKDIDDFPQEHAWSGSLYLTEKTFQCLNEMFSATKDIQDWLTLSAQLIATVCQRPVEWVTPIGLSVVQPYHKPMALTRYGVNTSDPWNSLEKPNALKQKNAFPPNFIHSLDSTHMMLTALFCLRAGITFVSVHDCFWTHASDVELMNKVCREQFVALHKQPILEDLSRQLIANYTPDTNSEEAADAPVVRAQQFLYSVLANVPARGDFDLKKVLESTYFFS